MTERVITNINLRRVASGDRVKPSDHNSLIDAVVRNAGIIGSLDTLVQGAALSYLEVVSIDNGTSLLTCKMPGDTGPEQYEVTLPPIYTETSRPFPEGNTTYVYTDINTRTASRAGETDETQYLTPPILVGESIACTYSFQTINYIMLGDGRMWAIDPPAP